MHQLDGESWYDGVEAGRTRASKTHPSTPTCRDADAAVLASSSRERQPAGAPSSAALTASTARAASDRPASSAALSSLSCRRRAPSSCCVSSPGLSPAMPASLCSGGGGGEKGHAVGTRPHALGRPESQEPAAPWQGWPSTSSHSADLFCCSPPPGTGPSGGASCRRRRLPPLSGLEPQSPGRCQTGCPGPASCGERGRGHRGGGGAGEAAREAPEVGKAAPASNSSTTSSPTQQPAHLSGPCSSAVQKLAKSRERAPERLSRMGKCC